jgi:hypothetical protein
MCCSCHNGIAAPLDKTLEGGSSAPLNTSLDDWRPVIVGANHFLVWCEILSKPIHKFFETPAFVDCPLFRFSQVHLWSSLTAVSLLLGLQQCNLPFLFSQTPAMSENGDEYDEHYYQNNVNSSHKDEHEYDDNNYDKFDNF